MYDENVRAYVNKASFLCGCLYIFTHTHTHLHHTGRIGPLPAEQRSLYIMMKECVSVCGNIHICRLYIYIYIYIINMCVCVRVYIHIHVKNIRTQLYVCVRESV